MDMTLIPLKIPLGSSFMATYEHVYLYDMNIHFLHDD